MENRLEILQMDRAQLEQLLRAVVQSEISAIQKPDNVTEYIGVAEAATLFKCHPNSIRNWIKSKRFPAYTMSGKDLVMKRSELEASLIIVNP